MNWRKSQSSIFRIGSTNPVEQVLTNGFPYSRRLSSHTSCVNALAFSSRDGRYLASGGDDLSIKIWDFHQEDVKSPSCKFVGPLGSIFTLAFSANDRYLYAGGLCSQVRRYDANVMIDSAQPQRTYPYREDSSIRSLSCHPFNENICLSATEDGTFNRYDARSNSCGDTITVDAEASGAIYHPQMSHLFATSDVRGNACLRDERMAFNSTGNPGIVLQFNTKLTKRSVKRLCSPEIGSISFDREGEKLSVAFTHYLPTIYSISDPNPVAVCSAPGSYVNSCTMKHGSFGGPGMDSDVFYGAGSDDFRGYVWRIPAISKLLHQRKEIPAADWESDCGGPDTIAFTEGISAVKYVPTDLSTPFCHLNGHRSIVNTVLFHPQLLHVATSGIERDIILHSPTPGSPCTRDLARTPTPTEVRAMSADNARGDRPAPLTEEDKEEEEVISLFDHILLVDGQPDIFETRQWSPSDSSDEEGESEEMSLAIF